MTMLQISAVIVGLAVAVPSTAAEAQHDNWPTKPIRVVVPFSPGSPIEVPARAVDPIKSTSNTNANQKYSRARIVYSSASAELATDSGYRGCDGAGTNIRSSADACWIYTGADARGRVMRHRLALRLFQCFAT